MWKVVSAAGKKYFFATYKSSMSQNLGLLSTFLKTQISNICFSKLENNLNFVPLLWNFQIITQDFDL